MTPLFGMELIWLYELTQFEFKEDHRVIVGIFISCEIETIIKVLGV